MVFLSQSRPVVFKLCFLQPQGFRGPLPWVLEVHSLYNEIDERNFRTSVEFLFFCPCMYMIGAGVVVVVNNQ